MAMKPKGNDYWIKNNVVYVVLTNTKNIMLCDVDKWDKLKDRTWYECHGYARTNKNRKPFMFHKQIVKCSDEYVIDHINRNKLDNRSKNLRIVTREVNAINVKCHKNNNSGYKGITKVEYGYIATIRANKKRIYLGFFKDIEKAIEARKEAEKKYHNPIIEKETLH